MARRRRRASAERLRDATRKALRRDLDATPKQRRGRSWRRPLAVRADGSLPRWLQRWAPWVTLPLFAWMYLVMKWHLAALVLAWAPMLLARIGRGYALELSREGVRLLRARPRRIVPWASIRAFEEVSGGVRFDEAPENGPAISHRFTGVPQAQLFRAAAIFRAQVTAAVFD